MGLGDVQEVDRHGSVTLVALRSFVIVGAPILRTEDVLEAVATRSPDDGHAYVVLTLSPRGAESLETATDAWLGRRIAIMIDGHVESAPVIRSKISSGSVSITIGAGDSPTRMAEARKLARGLAVRH